MMSLGNAENKVAVEKNEVMNVDFTERHDKLTAFYENIELDGKIFAIVKGGVKDNYYCTECYNQVGPHAEKCPRCNHDFRK